MWKLLFHAQVFSTGTSGSLVCSGEGRGQEPEQYAVVHQRQTTESLCLAGVSPQGQLASTELTQAAGRRKDCLKHPRCSSPPLCFYCLQLAMSSALFPSGLYLPRQLTHAIPRAGRFSLHLAVERCHCPPPTCPAPARCPPALLDSGWDPLPLFAELDCCYLL